MRLVLIISLVFVNVFFYKQTQTNIILWSKDKHLTWNDFKGIVDGKSIHHANTSSGIYKSYKRTGDTLVLTVVAEFYPMKSWVNPNNKTENLLIHEQKHFDVVEIYARKLCQSFISFKFTKNNFKNEINLLYDKNRIEKLKYQGLYDSITNHSIIKVKQLEWEKKIAKELKDLEPCSNTVIKILLK